MQISLRGIANRAKRLKDYRFLNLYTMLNEYNLLDSWQYVKKNVAYGVDKVSAREIERDLQSQVGSLVERLKRKSYRAKLVRRPRITQQRNYQLNFQRALCWCGSEYYWRARCGKTARRDLYGGRRVTGVPTVTRLKGEPWSDEPAKLETSKQRPEEESGNQRREVRRQKIRVSARSLVLISDIWVIWKFLSAIMQK